MKTSLPFGASKRGCKPSTTEKSDIRLPLFWLLLLLLVAAGTTAMAQEPPQELPDGLESEPLDMEAIMDGFEAAPVREGEAPSVEDLLDDFGEGSGATETASPAAAQRPLAPFSIDGHLKVGATWNVSHEADDRGPTDWRGLSGLEAELKATLNGKLGEAGA
jgi:hypothetical protein